MRCASPRPRTHDDTPRRRSAASTTRFACTTLVVVVVVWLLCSDLAGSHDRSTARAAATRGEHVARAYRAQSPLQAWLSLSPQQQQQQQQQQSGAGATAAAAAVVPLHAYVATHAAAHNSSNNRNLTAHDAQRGRYVVLTTHGGRRGGAWLSLQRLLTRTGVVRSIVDDVHVIDRTHLLVYMRDAGLSSLARALATPQHQHDNNNDHTRGVDAARLLWTTTTWRVLDVYGATPHTALLKLSGALQQRLQHTMSHNDNVDNNDDDDDALLEVMVYTAAGAAAMVAHDLQHSPRLQQQQQQQAHDVDDDSAPCHWHVHEHTGTRQHDSYVLLHVSTTTTTTAATRDATRRTCTRARRLQLLQVVAQHPAVRWLEHATRHALPLNHIAAAAVQGGCDDMTTHDNNMDGRRLLTTTTTTSRPHAAAEPTHPLWQAGITGRGEIVQVADSGLDVYSCYFYDAHHAVAYYPAVSTQHRKIVSYYMCNVTDGAANYSDRVDGHGTHVAGSAVGATAASPSQPVTTTTTTTTTAAAASSMQRYNGVAPDARLFVRDLGCTDRTTLVLPSDLGSVFMPGYAAGARIASNSWGFTAAHAYTGAERVLDGLAQRHDDLLLVFAAGNTPRAGVTSPGVAKNVLTVGAHV